MPYVSSTTKQHFQYLLDELKIDPPQDEGQLTYLLTEVALAYLRASPKRFSTLCRIEGAFGCAKAEFARRVRDRYEDQKIAENGDVFTIEDLAP